MLNIYVTEEDVKERQWEGDKKSAVTSTDVLLQCSLGPEKYLNRQRHLFLQT